MIFKFLHIKLLLDEHIEFLPGLIIGKPLFMIVKPETFQITTMPVIKARYCSQFTYL